MMHTFEEWNLLITAPTEGDEFQILEDWKTERDMSIKETAKMAGRTAKLIEALEAARYAMWDVQTRCSPISKKYRMLTKAKDETDAVLEEVRHKEGEQCPGSSGS